MLSALLLALPLFALDLPAPAVLRMPAPAPKAVDPVGSWTLKTVLNDEPGTMKLLIAREKGALVADVTTLMGSTVRARSVTLKSDHMTIEAEVHEGMVLTMELDFRGDAVSGRWVAGEYNGELKGERTKEKT